MTEKSKDLTRRSLITKAAIGIPAMGVAGALAWVNPGTTPQASASSADGYWGTDTTKKLQYYYNLFIKDGTIAGQEPSIRNDNPGLTTGWDWSDASGSATIDALQDHMNQWGYGLSTDGVLGPNTIWCLHEWFQLSPKTYLGEGDSCIVPLQNWLNS